MPADLRSAWWTITVTADHDEAGEPGRHRSAEAGADHRPGEHQIQCSNRRPIAPLPRGRQGDKLARFRSHAARPVSMPREHARIPAYTGTPPAEGEARTRQAFTIDRSERARIAWSWLLLVTIFLHALVPIGSPLARTNGSPFSASTIEVSTTPSRATTAPAREQVGEPGPDTAPALLAAGPAAAARFLPGPRLGDGQSALPTADPPPHSARLRPLGARAPPAS
jgi:hypothetical protein